MRSPGKIKVVKKKIPARADPGPMVRTHGADPGPMVRTQVLADVEKNQVLADIVGAQVLADVVGKNNLQFCFGKGIIPPSTLLQVNFVVIIVKCRHACQKRTTFA